jgi:hypothetical protein
VEKPKAACFFGISLKRDYQEHALGIPLMQMAQLGTYVVRKQLTGQQRYPLVLMLEPLFRCNLACSGCGKIDYPDKILNQRLSYDECMEAID